MPLNEIYRLCIYFLRKCIYYTCCVWRISTVSLCVPVRACLGKHVNFLPYPSTKQEDLSYFLSVTFHKYNIYTRDLARAQAILFCHSSHSVLPLFSLSLAHPSSSSLVRNNLISPGDSPVSAGKSHGSVRFSLSRSQRKDCSTGYDTSIHTQVVCKWFGVSLQGGYKAAWEWRTSSGLLPPRPRFTNMGPFSFVGSA